MSRTWSAEARRQSHLTRRRKLTGKLQREFGQFSEREWRIWKRSRALAYQLGYGRGVKSGKEAVARRIAREEAA